MLSVALVEKVEGEASAFQALHGSRNRQEDQGVGEVSAIDYTFDSYMVYAFHSSL